MEVSLKLEARALMKLLFFKTPLFLLQKQATIKFLNLHSGYHELLDNKKAKEDIRSQ